MISYNFYDFNIILNILNNDDILHLILQNLIFGEVLILLLVSRRFNKKIKQNNIWKTKINAYIEKELISENFHHVNICELCQTHESPHNNFWFDAYNLLYKKYSNYSSQLNKISFYIFNLNAKTKYTIVDINRRLISYVSNPHITMQSIRDADWSYHFSLDDVVQIDETLYLNLNIRLKIDDMAILNKNILIKLHDDIIGAYNTVIDQINITYRIYPRNKILPNLYFYNKNNKNKDDMDNDVDKSSGFFSINFPHIVMRNSIMRELMFENIMKKVNVSYYIEI